jgi:hypothetical protein
MGYRAVPNSPKTSSGKDRYRQGQYNLINPSKYLGDPTCIYWRSSWEYKLYFFLDNEPRVLKWNVEGITIPYEMEVTDGSGRKKWETMRYHPDAYCEIKQLDGVVTKNVIEIKPYNETIPPEYPKRVTAKSLETHEYRLKMFLKNFNKWKKAKEWCEKRGLNFFVMTEKYFEKHDVKLF